MRSDTEILKDMIDAVLDYNSLRDEEWDFAERNGDPSMWNAETEREHDELLDEIFDRRMEIRSLIVEATGDDQIEF